MQIGPVLVTATAAKTPFAFRPESAWRHDNFLDEKLLKAKRVCLVWLARVVLAKQKAKEFVLFVP